MENIKLQNTDKKLNKKNICGNIIKTETQLYEKEVVILLNTVLNFKSKHIIKGAIAQIKKKLVKLTNKSNLSEDSNISKQKLKQTKRFKPSWKTKKFENEKWGFLQTFPIINMANLAIRAWFNHKIP